MLNLQVQCVSQEEEGARFLSALVSYLFINMLWDEEHSRFHSPALNSDILSYSCVFFCQNKWVSLKIILGIVTIDIQLVINLSSLSWQPTPLYLFCGTAVGSAVGPTPINEVGLSFILAGVELGSANGTWEERAGLRECEEAFPVFGSSVKWQAYWPALGPRSVSG